MTRDLATVLTAIIAEIPDTEPYLRGRLEHVHFATGYTAPEVMSYRWQQAAAAFDEAFCQRQPPMPEWVAKVRAMWMGTT